MLEVSGLRKVFRLHIRNGKTITALDDVGFSLEQGEVLGLTGQSGSGKSTLMKCVYRTYLPTAGRIVLRTGSMGSVDLASADEHTVLRVRRTAMTYCSQFLQVIPRVPAFDVVAEPLRRRGADPDEARRAVRDCLQRLDLPEELWDAYPSTFSGGEQQRVNIARAIIARPGFLLVDEPTSSLDLKTKDAVIDMLRELRAAGTSILLITHDAHTLSRLADRRLDLQHGRVREALRA